MQKAVWNAYLTTSGRLADRPASLAFRLGGTMNVLWLLLVVAVGAYLVYAMLRPEDF